MSPSTITPLIAALLLLPCSTLRSAPGEDPEMQARSRNSLLNRGTLSLDKLLESPNLSPTQTTSINLLLQELRLEMHLFLDHSDLEGDALQAKLQDLLEVTRNKVTILATPERTPTNTPPK